MTSWASTQGQGFHGLRYSSAVRRNFRFLLICLLSLALPFKALAGAAMVGCGPAHHAAVTGAAAPNATLAAQAADGLGARDAHAAHGGAAGAQGQHAGGLVADVDVALDGAAKPDSAKPAIDHGAKASTVKCSSCAACCAAAAPAPDFHRWTAAGPDHRESPFRADRYSGVVTDVPHAPPRLILA